MANDSFNRAFELRLARLLDPAQHVERYTLVRGAPRACHLSQGWGERKFRDYVELMHAPGCRSGACKGCA